MFPTPCKADPQDPRAGAEQQSPSVTLSEQKLRWQSRGDPATPSELCPCACTHRS